MNDALRSIPSLLLRTGYVDAHATFGAFNFRRRDLTARLELLAPMARSMIELWFLERPVPHASLAFAPEVDALVTAGVLRRNGDDVSAACIALPMFGQIVLLPSPTNVGTVTYAPDTFALALRVGPPRRGRCLDLCTGSGIQALRAAAAGCAVIAIEIDPVASEWARRNAVVNSLDDRIDVRTGDLWAVAGDEPFDYICGNPPFGFAPSRLQLPVHAGGEDGLAVMRRVIEQIPQRLAPGGVAHFVGGSLGTDESAQIVDEIRALYAHQRMRVVISVMSRQSLLPGAPLFVQLVRMYEAGNVANAASVLEEHLRSLGKTHFYYYMVVASHADELAIEVTRLDRAGGASFFL